MDPFKVKVWNMTEMSEADKQQLRVRRLFLALVAYAIPLSVIVGAWLLDQAPVESVIYFISVPLIALPFFYVMIRSGLNLRFKDPSMTAMQLLVSLIASHCALHFAPESRHIMLITMIAGYGFGVFKLSAIELR